MSDLENRLEVSANQEVQFLERFNDLTQSLESMRSERRKAEAGAAQLERELAESRTQLADARNATSSATARLEQELQDTKDELADAREELDEAAERESKTRANLLEQLSQAQREAASLKRELRADQRRKARGGGSIDGRP